MKKRFSVLGTIALMALVFLSACAKDIQSYTITWKNWDGSILETTVVEEGNIPAFSKETPTKESTGQYTYVFKGWDSTPSAAESNAEYIAVFDQVERQYDIVWKNWDGSILQTEQYAYGEMPQYTEATPTRQGNQQYTYIFDGWNNTPVQVVANAEYIAEFSKTTNKVSLSFNNNDGSDLTTITKDYAEQVDEPLAPTKTGYTFTSWHYDSLLTQPVEWPITLTEPKTLHASWQANTLTAKYHGNGNTSGNTADSSHVYDTENRLNKNNYIKTGYNFLGWATSADGEVVYNDRAVISNQIKQSGGTLDLYAIWQAKALEIFYDYDNSDINMTSNHTYGIETKLNVNTYNKGATTVNASIFIGWATSKSRADSELVDFKDEEMVTNQIIDQNNGNITLYPVWVLSNSLFSFSYDIYEYGFATITGLTTKAHELINNGYLTKISNLPAILNTPEHGLISVTSIRAGALNNSEIKYVYVHNNIVQIESGALNESTYIEVSPHNNFYYSVNGKLFTK